MSVKSGALPGLLSGEPEFEDALPIVRPMIPPLDAIEGRLAQAMASGQLTNNGRHVRELEELLAERLQVGHVVCVANGTIGLAILCKALTDRGEVLLPSFTFSATAHAVVWAGLRPIFVDIAEDDFTLDPGAVAERIGPDTAAVLGVHVYGHPCRIADLQELADHHQVPLIFDAAHAFGSSYEGRPIGGFGLAELFSFHATKVFPVGEGGAITTDDEALARELRLLRNFGDSGTENTIRHGCNGKMQEFNALLGLENLKVVDEHIARRRAVGALMTERLSSLPGLAMQRHSPSAGVNFQNFPITVDGTAFGLDRDLLWTALAAENVFCRKYFFPPLHRHESYCGGGAPPTGYRLPVTDDVADKVLCVPIYSDMSDDTARRICDSIERIHHHATRIREVIDRGDPPRATTT